MSDTWPTTIREAVQRLCEQLDADGVRTLRGMTREEASAACHFGLGMYIRNEFGLWGLNWRLRGECGTMDPDDASTRIVLALWDHLQATATAEELAEAREFVRARRAAERAEWMAREVPRDAAITARRCPKCACPCPLYRKTCKYCGYAIGRV